MVDPKKYNTGDPSDLRRKAEKTVSLKEAKHGKPLSPEEMQQALHELRVHQIELEMQNEELLRTHAELDAARVRYSDLYDLAPVGYCTVSEKGLILEANLTAARMLGVSRGALLKHPISKFILNEDQDIYYIHRKQLFQADEPQVCELRMLRKGGMPFWARMEAAVAPPQSPLVMNLSNTPDGHSAEGAAVCLVVISDISERKSQEDELELTARLIVLVNTPGDFRECMSALAASLQGWSGCEAVGIRLREGNDYPYYVTRGFPAEFIQGENLLCSYDREGKVLRDDAGNPVLDCMCGNILSGRFDSSKPFFTAHGSFWTNSTSALLANTTKTNRQSRMRNRCNAEGYESMALIPLRAGNQTLGLLQLNDRRPDCFTPVLIAHFERMADSLAIALLRHQTEAELQESVMRYATTLAAVDDGLWDWHVPSGKAFFNTIYYRMLGYEDGGFSASYDSWRRLVHPDDIGRVEQGLRQGLESEKGFNIDFRMKMKSGEWLWVCTRGKAVEKDAKGKALRMVGTLSDITDRKNMEMQLVDSRKMLQLVINNVPQSIFWKDRKSVYLGCNINFAKNAGVARVEDIVGKTDYDLAWKKEEADFFRKCDDEVIKSDSPMYHIEETQRQANGKDIWLDTNKMPLHDADGKVVGILGSFDDITERKKAEDALKESEEKLQNLFVNAPIGIFHSVVEGRFLSANPALATILGYSGPEDLVSLTADMSTQIYADPKIRMQIVDALIKTDGWVHYEEVIWRRKDHRLITVDITGRKVLNADGGVAYLESFIIDITERKRTARRQVLLSEILGILNSPVALPDILNGVLAAVKRETGFDAVGIRLKSEDDYPYCSQDGFSKDFLLAENTLVKRDNDGGVCRDARGNIILECTCGLVISGKTDPVNPLFTPGGSFWTNNSFPLLDLPSDQDPRIHPRNRCIHDGYASVALIPIRAGQEIVGLLQLNNRKEDSLTFDMIHFFEGICASIGMALMQKQAEENYRTLFNEMLDGFALHEIICDSEGNPADYRFVAVNPAFERMTGLKAGEIVGRTVLETLPNTERYWIETYGNVAITGKPAFLKNYSSELGKYFEVTAFRPAPKQFACIFTDVTGRKRVEGEKDKLQQQLMESQKMQAVGQLAGGISHDFNNLLSVINGYSQLLVRNSDLKPTAVQQVEEILRAGERAAELTRQLLVFSRRQAMEFKIVDLNTIVSGTNKMLRRIVRENIDMAIVEGPNLGKIKADPGQVEQVIMNLVVNASDAMPNGGTITIKTENVKFGGNGNHKEIKPGPYVMLSVSDTGCGMDNEVKEHIFEPFFTTKDVGKGTGLGLAIIYGVVKQSNAYIDVQSEQGKGTKFQIYFPQIVEDVTVEEECHTVVSFPRGSETIMIAEDEEGIRLMLEGFLQSLGYTVLTACDGKKALEIAESHKGKINLLLTDIVMPGMNGFELGKKLKKSIPDIKLLFMSGYIKPTSTQEMMKISDNLIDKPVSIHALSVKLREILG